MRCFIALVLLILPNLTLALDWEDRRLFNAAASEKSLRIISSTDTRFFEPIIDGFVAENPEVTVEYLVTETTALDQVFRASPDEFDLVVSSAMDLQLKLANDGYALRLNDLRHPPRAQWRQSLFAFTSEPAAIVLNTSAFTGQPIPQTRQEVIQALRARPDVFDGRVGTYDVRQSGLGYLFATQDARASETYWRLMEVMGSLDTRLYCCSGDMISDLIDGTILVAYNVLGSYADAQIGNESDLEVILPSDFPTTMMRTALVSYEAPNPATATKFLEHLILVQSAQKKTIGPLPSLYTQHGDVENATIALEPALMTFLDAQKRQKFLSEWEDAVIQE